mmetsp:Transcript_60568/g.187656  ORF Transcript_60568/g.187656 Transcript_60568/m.187656 type:complete len:383 (-) Transcript_60568:735-1883(-)
MLLQGAGRREDVQHREVSEAYRRALGRDRVAPGRHCGPDPWHRHPHNRDLGARGRHQECDGQPQGGECHLRWQGGRHQRGHRRSQARHRVCQGLEDGDGGQGRFGGRPPAAPHGRRPRLARRRAAAAPPHRAAWRGVRLRVPRQRHPGHAGSSPRDVHGDQGPSRRGGVSGPGRLREDEARPRDREAGRGEGEAREGEARGRKDGAPPGGSGGEAGGGERAGRGQGLHGDPHHAVRGQGQRVGRPLADARGGADRTEPGHGGVGDGRGAQLEGKPHARGPAEGPGARAGAALGRQDAGRAGEAEEGLCAPGRSCRPPPQPRALRGGAEGEGLGGPLREGPLHHQGPRQQARGPGAGRGDDQVLLRQGDERRRHRTGCKGRGN